MALSDKLQKTREFRSEILDILEKLKEEDRTLNAITNAYCTRHNIKSYIQKNRLINRIRYHLNYMVRQKILERKVRWRGKVKTIVYNIVSE